MNKLNNIVLVGPMGAGKSSVGKRLAQILGLPFVDSDHEIESRLKVTIATIFDLEGEEGFRQRESVVIADLATSPVKKVSSAQQYIFLMIINKYYYHPSNPVSLKIW